MTGRWREGERGRTGDHGQTGTEGATGKTGQAGQTGIQGVAGPRGPVVTWGMLLAFLILIGAGYLGFNESQRNDEESARQRVQLEQQQDALCKNQQDSREALRQVYRDIANLGRSVSAGSGRQKALMESFDAFEADRLKSLEPIPDGCPE